MKSVYCSTLRINIQRSLEIISVIGDVVQFYTVLIVQKLMDWFALSVYRSGGQFDMSAI
jgi:hypothetical protein